MGGIKKQSDEGYRSQRRENQSFQLKTSATHLYNHGVLIARNALAFDFRLLSN